MNLIDWRSFFRGVEPVREHLKSHRQTAGASHQRGTQGLGRIRGHSRSQPSSKFHVYVMTDARRMRAAEVKLAVFLRRAILSSKTQIELSGRGS